MTTSRMHGFIQHLRRSTPRDAPGATDGQLLSAYLGRQDRDALAALVRRHGPMVWGVCRRLLGNEHDAEDAFQATFVVLIRKAASVAPRRLVGNWLYGVAYQTALKARATSARRKTRERQVVNMPEAIAAAGRPDSNAHAVLDEEIHRLPDRYRSVVVLCEFQGQTRKEAARQLGVPEGTVAGRLARAKTLLGRRLTARGVSLAGGALAAALHENGVRAAAVADAVKTVMLAAAGSAAVPVQITALAEGVLKSMLLSKIKAAMCFMLVLTGMTTGGVGLTWSQQVAADEPPPVRRAHAAGESGGPRDPVQREVAADMARSRDNLKQIGAAMHKYHDAKGHFPRAAIIGLRKGTFRKPLLSWRVAILPFLGEEALYKEFRLDEPWDSDHNKKLLAKMPKVYAAPGLKTSEPNATIYQVFYGEGSMFDDAILIDILALKDGSSSTIMVVEGGEPVPWTKPQDLPFDKSKDLPKMGNLFGDGFHALAGDGFVHFIKNGFDPTKLRQAITRAGNEIVNLNELNP